MPMLSPLSMRQRSRSGVAIIFALIAIVLITVIILAFFSRAQLNRQISFTSTNEVRADLLSHSAFDIIIGELRQEIASGSTSLNGGNSAYATIYQPNTAADTILKRLGIDGTASATIAKVSANNLGLYAAGRVLGSSTSVSATSRNGRYISTATWFGTGGPALGTQTTLPTWVFITRGNGVEIPTIANAQDPTKPDYVIGRFAYTVYDIGGLLNANAAGYPSSDTSDPPYKSSEAFADLSQISFLTAPDTLVNWRNAADVSSAPAYAAYVKTYGQTSGFLSTHVGDNAFLSRHDLMNFLQQIMGLSPSSQPQPFLALTHFSRSLNAPSWGPVANASTMGGSTSSLYAYNTNANTSTAAPFSTTSPNPNRFLPNVRFTSAGSVTHYDDSGTSSTYTVAAGAPLVQHRFSLAKLAWLTSSGPAAGISAAAIQSCFGLEWENSPTFGTDNSVTGGYGWVYAGSTATASATPIALASIETLDQVAAERREPNFFELLQAGILSGVPGVNNKGYLGQGTANPSAPASGLAYAFQSNSFLHTLTIGANLIDQYKADSYPTILIGQYGGAADMITGTKSLPAIDTYMEVAGANPTTPANLSSYLTVNLWNPYVLPAGGSAGAQPTIRIHMQGGYTQNDGWASNAGVATANPQTTYALPAAAPMDAWAQIAATNFSSFNTVAPVTTTTIGTTSNWATVPTVMAGKLTGFQFPDVVTDPTRKTIVASNPTSNASNDPAVEYLQNYLGTLTNPFNIVAEYQPAGTTFWIPYSFLDGINDPVTWRTGSMVHWMNNSRINSASSTTPRPFTSTQTTVGPLDLKSDPRSTRFNEFEWSGTPSPTTANLPFLPLSFVSADGLGAGNQEQFIPQLFTGSPSGAEILSAAPYFSPASLAFNNGGGSAGYNSYTDLDGVMRLADYGLFTGDTWVNTPFGAATGTTAQTAANSPIILNRAFRSVGEMGYAFIDLPWRSINFCDRNNAFAGLLDIFSLTDEPTVVDDRVSLNAPQPVILQSLLSGSAQAPDGTSMLAQPGTLATAYNTYALTTAGTATSTLPITPAQMTDFLYSLGTSDGLDAVKAHREAVVRAVAGNTQTRTWNVLIDVVAQVGRYGKSATSLNDFIVEGEKRYWLSAAIDRYTGSVISQSLEPVNE